jgi:ribose-phosphate pyrophosphokinase
MYGDIKLYAGSACPELAQRVADYIGTRLSRWTVTTFPNENIFIRLNSSVRGQDVYLIQTHDRPVHSNIMEMLIAIDCFKRDSAGRVTVVVPYMSYSQSDKKDQPRVPITARLLADMIEVAGADRWITIDLHAGQIQGFYKIPGDSLTALHIICNYIRQKNLDATVVTTDLGFAKGGPQLRRGAGLLAGFRREASHGQRGRPRGADAHRQRRRQGRAHRR